MVPPINAAVLKVLLKFMCFIARLQLGSNKCTFPQLATTFTGGVRLTTCKTVFYRRKVSGRPYASAHTVLMRMLFRRIPTLGRMAGVHQRGTRRYGSLKRGSHRCFSSDMRHHRIDCCPELMAR